MKMRFSSYHQILFMWMMLLSIGMIHWGRAQSVAVPEWYNEKGETISGAMSGGCLAPQFSMFDLNEDGRQELIKFDRFSGGIGVWHNFYVIRYVCIWARI